MERLPLKPESYKIRSTDNVEIHVWKFRTTSRKSPKGVFVQFHGNAQNMTAHFNNLYPVLTYGYDLVTFDYRGYGESTGEPEPKGVMEDGVATLKWVQKEYPNTPIIVFGQSLGGAVAMSSLLELKNQVPIHALILDSTFASYRTVARRVLAGNWITWIFQPIGWLIVDNSQAPKGKLHKLGTYKKYVVHGTADHIVTYPNGEEIFEEISEPKVFWRIENGTHTDFLWRENGKFANKLIDELDISTANLKKEATSK